MKTGPLMRRYKPNISAFIKYQQLKETFYTDPLYRKIPSHSESKLSHLFTFCDFILVAPMKSKSYIGIGLMDICDEDGIPA